MPHTKQTDVTQSRHRRWKTVATEAEPAALGNFCDFAVKISNFDAILITFHTS